MTKLLSTNHKNRLCARLNRVRQLTSVGYVDECRYLMQFLQSNEYFKSLLAEIDANVSVDVLEWMHEVDRAGKLSFPETEAARAKICFGILKTCAGASNPTSQYLHWARRFGRHSLSDQVLQEFTEGIIKPLVDYLCDRIEDQEHLLYLIERFKLKCEWFRQDELFDRYVHAPTAGELQLTNELRASLFDSGIDFPFSQPESPSGKADTVATLGTRHPLPLEVKVFDPMRGRRASNLWQGFHQVFRYAQDYHSSVGYLVIFNCSNQELVIAPEEGTDPEYPIRIEHGGKSFFVITINLGPDRPSASKEDPSSRVSVLHNQLVGNAGVTR